MAVASGFPLKLSRGPNIEVIAGCKLATFLDRCCNKRVTVIDFMTWLKAKNILFRARTALNSTFPRTKTTLNTLLSAPFTGYRNIIGANRNTRIARFFIRKSKALFIRLSPFVSVTLILVPSQSRF